MKKLLIGMLALVLVFAISCAPEAKHEHTYVEKSVDATCEEAGKTYKECSTCGDVIDVKEIPATGHSEDLNKVLDKEPTEEAEGLYNFVCPDCKKVVEKETIAKLNFGEIFVPEDVVLEEMDDALVKFMKAYIDDGENVYDSSIADFKSITHLVVDNAEFKPEAVVNDRTIKEGSGSFICDEISKESKSFTLNATIVQAIDADPMGTYEIKMVFDNAVFSRKWDSDESVWKDIEINDPNAFKVEETLNGEAINDIPVTYEQVWAFCEGLSNSPTAFASLSTYDIIYSGKSSVFGENNSVIYVTGGISTFKPDGSGINEEYFNGKIKRSEVEHSVAYGLTDKGFKYIKIDDKFYNPDKLNKALAGSEE